MSNRNSVICIAKGINIDKNYNNTLALSRDEIKSLCQNSSNCVYIGSDYSFVRTENKIKVQAPFSQIFPGNYCYIINQGITQFFFVDDVKYISDVTTEIEVIEDVVTTYKPTTFNKAYIERQHTQNDNVANFAVESINFERYVLNEYKEIDVTPIKVMAEYAEYQEEDGSFYRPSDPRVPSNERAGMVETGLTKKAPSMLYRAKGYLGDSDISTTETLNQSGITRITDVNFAFVNEGHTTSLLGVKTYPREGFQVVSQNKLTKLDGYTPKNKKCLQHPYYYINFTNNSGQSNILKPEMFNTSIDSSRMTYRCASCCHGVVQSFAYPQDYNGRDFGYDYGLVIDNFPQLPMAVDSYAAYVAQRGNTSMAGVGAAAVAGGVSLIAGIATANPVLAVSGAMGVASAVGNTISSAAFTPDNQGDGVVGRASGDFMNYCLDNFKFRIEQVTVTAQDAKRIDDYFTTFGYAQNEIQDIKTTNPRFHCHHVKTMPGEAVVEGIPQAKADIINQAFARGITFWDSNSEVGNYNLK